MDRKQEAAKYVDLALRANSEHPVATRINEALKKL